MLISLLFAVFLTTSINIEYGMGFSAVLMLLVSVVGLVATRNEEYQPLQTWEKYWVASLFFFVGLVYIDILRGFGGIGDIDSQSRLLLAIPVYLYIRRVGINLKIVLIGIAVAAMLTGVYAWYQHVELGIARVSSFTNAIYYGDISIMLFVLCVVSALSVKNAWFKLLLFICSFFMLYAVLSSGTRGGWVALSTLFILFVSYNVWNISLWKRLLSLILFVVVLVGAYHSPNLIVKQRVDSAIDQVSSYYTDGKMSSVRYRLEMWKASYLSAKDHNFFGAGEGSFRPEVVRLAKDGLIDKSLQQFVGPHSQYFNALLDQGIVGLMSLILIFIIPITVLLNSLNNHNEPNKTAILPLALLLVFMEFMLTISALEIQIMSLFFSFTLSIFLGLFTHNRNYE